MRPYFIFLLFRRIGAIRYLMKDPTVPFFQKALIIFGIVYLISPVDLIPFPVLGFSVIDDLTLWVFILSYLKDQLDKYYPNRDKQERKKYKGKNIIDSVEYEIKKDDNNNGKDEGNE